MKSLFLFTIALVFALPVGAAPLDWHFERSADGSPEMLVWQTEIGISYDLCFTEDLAVPFTHVEGFPQDGDGGEMEYPFTPGSRGFFQITSEVSVPDGFALIPAGSFLMGDQTAPNYEGFSIERPQHSVYVSAFYMPKHQVTKALWDEVRDWGESHGYTDLPVGSMIDSTNHSKGANHPVHMINWYAMLKWCNARSEMENPPLTPCYRVSGSVYRTGNSDTATCDWGANGYRLPSEAEWEKAARGGVEGARYPWGTDTISHAQANYFARGTSWGNLSGDDGFHPTYNDGVPVFTSPVGSFEPNGYGLYDMAGNLWDWCWDWFGEVYYATSPASDPHGPVSGTWRVARGGSWFSEEAFCRVAHRSAYTTDNAGGDGGFRPARSLVP